MQPRTYGHSTSESESASGLRSPGFAKSPVLIRSHYWLPSSQNNILQSAAPKRPGLAPSPLGNERNRSNSESILQATQNNKNKRMGIVPKKYADHTFLEETRANKNSLHSRGHSHGSALRHTVRTSDVKPSNVVIGQMKESQGGVLVHRLSSLPEQKEAVLPVDKMFGAAKGLLYSLNLPHPQIMILEPVIKYGSLARLSLERVFPNAATHIDRLGQDLSKNTRNAIRYTEFKDEVKDIEIMAKATCASALAHQPVAKALSYGAEQLIEDADLRYVRTLMLFLYGSLNEISNSSTTLRLDQRGKIAPRSRAQQVSTTTQIANGEQRSANRDHSVTPTRERPKPERRWRNGSPVQRSNSHTSLRTARGAQTTVPLQLGRQSRSNSRATTLHSSASSSVVSTPRSGESFNSAAIAARSRRGSVDVSPEQAHTRKEQQDQFEQIFFCLTNSVDQGLRIIPTLEPFFLHNLDASQKQYPLQSFIKIWATLVARTRYCLEMSETLKIRLSTVKIVDPEARNARDFWRIVRNFVDSYYSLLATLRQARSLNLTPNEMRHQIQPIYKSTTEACSLIANSPWNHLTFETGLRTQPPSRAQTPAQSGDRTDRRHLPRGSGGPTVASSSSPYTLSVPATPLSAALGPAAQATVPATPASASLNRSFEGDVFQRADSLLNLQQTMIYRR